jgi:hypothetical protein
MSKMDNLRAMREARYDAAASRKPTVRPEPAKAAKAAPEKKPQDPALCGHRAISGRVCTREQGHSEKSHRYS